MAPPNETRKNKKAQKSKENKQKKKDATALVPYVPPAPTTLTNFPGFECLPIEIQLMVWKIHLGDKFNEAHFNDILRYTYQFKHIVSEPPYMPKFITTSNSDVSFQANKLYYGPEIVEKERDILEAQKAVLKVASINHLPRQMILGQWLKCLKTSPTQEAWYAKVIRNGLLQIFHNLVIQPPTKNTKAIQYALYNTAVAVAVAKSFPRFSELAPNIRAKIWGFAVGDMLPLTGYHNITRYNDGRGFCIHFSRSSAGTSYSYLAFGQHGDDWRWRVSPAPTPEVQEEYMAQRMLIHLSHANKQAREVVFREWLELVKKFEPANWKESNKKAMVVRILGEVLAQTYPNALKE